MLLFKIYSKIVEAATVHYRLQVKQLASFTVTFVNKSLIN